MVTSGTRPSTGYPERDDERAKLQRFRGQDPVHDLTAAMQGRAFAIPDDVRALALPVLAHRLIPAARVELRGRTKTDILTDLIEQIPVPAETVQSES